MKKQIKHKIRFYQDSKDLPFCNYKRIVQTGDLYFMVKGYEPGDVITLDANLLKEKFDEIEEDYATSMNVKNHDVIIYGQHAIATNEFNKYNIILHLIELTIRGTEIRTFHKLPESEDLNAYTIKDLLKDFKIQKSDDLYKQREFVLNKIEKIKNELLKIESQIKKADAERKDSEFEIEEQFVSVCLGLEIPVDDTKISLYQYGLMVKALIKRVEEINKMNSHAR
ncbi:UNVERIFIED_CONTAM: hypothetical protein POZ17_19670 [Ralstonia mannitolilytica]